MTAVTGLHKEEWIRNCQNALIDGFPFYTYIISQKLLSQQVDLLCLWQLFYQAYDQLNVLPNRHFHKVLAVYLFICLKLVVIIQFCFPKVAFKILQNCLYHDPYHLALLQKLSKLAQVLQYHDLAKFLLEIGLIRFPHNPSLLLQLSQLYIQNKNYKSALALLTQLKQNQQCTKAYLLLQQVNLKLIRESV